MGSIMNIWIASAIISVCVISLTHAGKPIVLSLIEEGQVLSYSTQKGSLRQDLSGGVLGSGGLLVVDDGGENAEFPSVRLLNPAKLLDISNPLPVATMYRDLEGATFSKDRYYVTTSMSLVGEDHPSYRLFGEILYDKDKQKFRQGRMVDFRDVISTAIAQIAPDST